MTTSDLHRVERKNTDRFFRILFLFFALTILSGGIFEHVVTYSDLACIELMEEESNKAEESKKESKIDDYTHQNLKLDELIHETDFLYISLNYNVGIHYLDVPTPPPEQA